MYLDFATQGFLNARKAVYQLIYLPSLLILNRQYCEYRFCVYERVYK